MDRTVASALFSFALFVGMLILLTVGRRIEAKHLASDPKGARAGTGTIEAAAFALLGICISNSLFSVSMTNRWLQVSARLQGQKASCSSEQR